MRHWDVLRQLLGLRALPGAGGSGRYGGLVCLSALYCVMAAGSAIAAPGGRNALDALHTLDALRTDPPLLDRAVPLSSWQSLDGSPAARPLAPAEWRQLMADLQRTGDQAWTDAPWTRLVDRSVRAAAGPIPIGLVNVRASTLREDAVESGGLVVRAGRLEVNADTHADVTTPVRIVAASPLAARTYRGERTTFVLDRDHFFSNDPEPATMEVDFDDHRGYRVAAWDTPLTVHWSTPGTKSISLRLTTDTGDVLHASSSFDVLRLGTPAPHDTLAVTATVPFDGLTASGQAYIYRSDQNAVLTNPVVVVEGFDLDNSLYWEELYVLLNQENMVETMRGLGFDLVVLNFTEATEPIQRNSFLVAELIQQVNAMTGDADMVVIGASMGGLASRYALSWMEQQSIPHHTRTYVSFDSPHGGANIPLGVQYWLDFFADLSDDAEFLLSRLDTPAARQLLLYHHQSPPTATGVADPLRADFLADMAAVGDWPALPRKVAVANGSATGAAQGFSAGEQVILYEYRSFLVDVDGDVWAVPDATSQMIFDGSVNIILLPEDALQVTVSGTDPIDNAPGGWRNSMAQMDSTEAPYGDIIALHDNHSFVPTISSLALATTDLFHDVDGDPALLALSPFDALYFPTAAPNQEHVSIAPETAAWLIAELEAGAVDTPDIAAATPGGMLLLQPNSPNPFRQETRIHFALGEAGHVTVDLFDVSGRRVARLLEDEPLIAGTHSVTWQASRGVPAGMYFYRVKADGAQAFGRVAKLQ